jgi:putative transposase
MEENVPERKHLQRLVCVYQNHPRYFITTCVHNRRSLLADPDVHEILCENWLKSLDLYGWAIGSYIVMPDHVHFFCVDAESRIPLSKMIGSWKQWTAKEICPLLGINAPLWQKEFFDHLIRSGESYSEKWEYVRLNPVRAGLIENIEEWKFSGNIDYK